MVGLRARMLVAVATACLTIGGIGAQAIAAPSSEAQSYLEKAQGLQKKGDAAGAIIQLKNAIRTDPDLSQARYELGILYLVTGDPGAAQRELELAKARGFDAAKLIQPLTQAYLAQGRFQEVIKNFNPEEFKGDAQSELLAVQARAQIGLQNTAAAKTLIDRALAQSPNTPNVLVAAAALARIENRFPDAAKYVDAGLAKDPDNAELQVLKAETLQQNKDFEGAIKVLDNTIAKYPRYSRARVAHAMINLGRGKPELMGEDIRAILAVEPKNPLGLYLRAFQLTQEKKYRDAVQVLLALPELLDAYPPARYLLAASSLADNQLQSALSNAELYLKKSPGDIIGLKLLASVALRLNDSKRAVDVLEPLAKDHPEDPQVRLQLATAYMGMGRSEEAIKLFREGLQEDPNNSQVRLALAVNELRAGAKDAGLEQLQKVIEANPGSLEANALLVMTHLQSRQIDKARMAADAMIKADPKNASAYNLKGTVELAANDPVSAKAAFKTAIEKDPKFVPALLNLARIDDRSDVNAAKDWFKKAVAAEPTNMAGYNGLAGYALREKKADEAAKIMEQAVTASPSAIEPRLRLIEILLSDRQTGRALVAARDLANVIPDDPRSVDALGRAQIAGRDFTNGVGTFRKLAAMSPKNAEVQRRLAGALLTAAVERATSAQPAGSEPGKLPPVKDWNPTMMAEGKAALDTAIALAPDYASPLNDRLSLERQINGDAGALALAQKYVQERPDSATRLVVAGDIESALGKNDLAAAHYRTALTKSKTNEILGRLYGALARDKKLAEGLTLLTNWAKENPDDYTVRFMITSAYINAGRFDDAIKETESMNGVLPDNPVLLNNLAWLYGERSNPRAFEVGQRALDLAPNSADVMDTLGWLETTKRDAKKGQALLAKSYELAPKSGTIGFHYAFALNRAGDKPKAKEVLKKVLSDTTSFKERVEAEALLKEIGG